jgi:hypothetical protein
MASQHAIFVRNRRRQILERIRGLHDLLTNHWFAGVGANADRRIQTYLSLSLGVTLVDMTEQRESDGRWRMSSSISKV